MVEGAEIPGNVINRQLSARKYGTEGVEEFMKKNLLFPGTRFYDTMQRSTLATQMK